MLDQLQLTRPGLFVTATDTEVGKTVITSAIALALRRQNPGLQLGISKPFASGCRREREGLVNADAEALAHFADCRMPLDTINPIRFKAPLAPAVAAEQTGEAIDWPKLTESLHRLDEAHDALLIEGVGGLLVPLDPADPGCTVLTLMRAIGYPAVVVARPGLGTLNHTTMTVRLLREAGVSVAGIVINGYDPNVSEAEDPALPTNRQWLRRLTDVPVLAVVPRVKADQCQPEKGLLSEDIVGAVAMQRWQGLLARPQAPTG
jgi:dethiobiotin synthetase